MAKKKEQTNQVSPTIEAAKNGFIVKPPSMWNSTEKPVVVKTIDEAIAEQGRMVKSAWDEKAKSFSIEIKDKTGLYE